MGRKKLVSDEAVVELFKMKLEYKEIAKKLGISPWTVISRLKKLDLRRNTRIVIERHDAFSLLTPESCYWIGFLAADATIWNNGKGFSLELKRSDERHLKKLCRFIGRIPRIYKRDRIKNRKIIKSSTIDVLSPQIANDLEKFGLIPRKSLILEPPREIPDHLIRHFLRGVVDGDGSVGWHTYSNSLRIDICSGSQKFIEWILDTLMRLEVYQGNQKISKREDGLCSLKFGNQKAISILSWLYDNVDSEILLDRKFATFRQGQERLSKRAKDKQKHIDRLISMYKNGMSYSEIGKKVGRTKGYVAYYLRKHPIKKRKLKTDSMEGRKIQKRDQEMLRKHRLGISVEALSEEYCLVKSSIYIALRRAVNQSEA